MRVRYILALAILAACSRDLPDDKPSYWDVKVTETSAVDTRGAVDKTAAEILQDSLPTAPGFAAPIAIDGLFDDWEEIAPLLEDPAGDGGPSGIDFTVIKIANDDTYIYFYLETGVEIELDWGHGLTLFIDCDSDADTGSAMHGFGAELRWVTGMRFGEVWSPNGVLDIGWGDIGFVAAPTVTSTVFELAFERKRLSSLVPACAFEQWTVWLADDTGPSGDLAPEGTDMARFTFDHTFVPPPGPAVLQKSESALRIISWNVLWSSILDPEKEPCYRHIFQALDPDIINLQEILEHEETEARLREWLGGEWHVLGFSDRVTISRLPVIWDWPASYEPLESRFTVVPLETGPEQMLVIFNAHLSFGANDADRQREADSFAAFIRDAQAGAGATHLPLDTPFILLGDLNLVGAAQQLTTLTTGDIVDTLSYGPPHLPDWDKTPLEDLHILQSGARMAWTWQVNDGGFWPGKLDFFIYSDSALTVVNRFVLNTKTMGEEQLVSWELEEGDTACASDHLPVIIDVLLSNAP